MAHGENAYDQLNEIEEYDELEVMKLEDKLCELNILEDKIIWDKSTPEIINNAKASFLIGLRLCVHERTSFTSVHLILFVPMDNFCHEPWSMVLSYHHRMFLSIKALS